MGGEEGRQAPPEDRSRRDARAAQLLPVQELLESVTDGFVALDQDWRYVYVNGRAAEMLGRPREELEGAHIWTVFPEGVGQPFHRAYERAMDERVMVVFEDHYEPWDRWFENRIYPTQSGGIAIYFQEITDRVSSQQELERLADQRSDLLERLVRTQEKERGRIARELHDSLGQTLSSLGLLVGDLERQIGDGAARPIVELVRERLDESTNELRAVVRSLHPAQLEHGLGQALATLIATTADESEIAAHFTNEIGDAPLTDATEATAFRVAQEAVTNVVRHAGAATLSVVLGTRDGWLVLVVDDDGVGLDPDASEGFGVLGMRDRAAAVGGHVLIESSPGRGTTVRLEAPM